MGYSRPDEASKSSLLAEAYDEASRPLKPCFLEHELDGVLCAPAIQKQDHQCCHRYVGHGKQPIVPYNTVIEWLGEAGVFRGKEHGDWYQRAAQIGARLWQADDEAEPTVLAYRGKGIDRPTAIGQLKQIHAPGFALVEALRRDLLALITRTMHERGLPVRIALI
jgi:hypothetical protein